MQRLAAAEPGSDTEFLLERYTAFTKWGRWRRCFRIRHRPWQQIPLRMEVEETTLLDSLGTWSAGLEFAGAHYSPGVREVEISAPMGV